MMPARTRYFSDDDFELGVTPSRLKRLGKAMQREYMLHWFRERFEDPAEETPYNSREGGYLYVWGGPYDAREQLGDEFGSLVSEELIDKAAEELESDGIVDWAPGRRHPDHERARDEREADYPDDGREELPDLDPIIRMLEGGQPPNFGNESEREQRQRALSDVAALQEVLTPLKPTHGGIGHNNPPPDYAPQVKAITEISEAASTIERELKKVKPDALEIAKTTSRLKRVMGWLGSRANAAVDKMVGAVLLETAMGSPFVGKVWSAVKSVSEWLINIAPWPF